MRKPQRDAGAVFEFLVHEHADMLTAYLRSLLGRDPSLDDLFQETMLVAWRRLDESDPSRPFAPWLRGIARHLVMEHARKRRARPLATDPDVLAAIDRRFDLLAQRPGDTFAQRTERLLVCLGRLPQAVQHLIELVYSRNLSLTAVAEAVGESREAITKRIQRARRQLADCMGVGESCP